ncbi:MAG: hypothetical protein FWF59_05410 [Turicibacter sp.]|nr:hypothetical protein [Turicibacter sp.]
MAVLESAGMEQFLPGAPLVGPAPVLIKLKTMPAAGDAVYAKSQNLTRPLELGKELATGGEGTIFLTSIEGYVAKVFKKEKLDSWKEEKIQLMCSRKVSCEGICFPIAPIYNKEQKFVGYLMRKAYGVELGRSIFLPPVLAKTFPDWKKKDLVRLCATILQKMEYLHSLNVIMGDINPANILVVSPSEVYFVDTDSYQVEGFPCPVSMPNFVAPEIQGKNFRKFLRTKGHEYFAIATLLFMIMLPGQKPYAKKGSSGNLMENIKAMDFPYEVAGGSGEGIPSGLWSRIWEHLPVPIRSAFYHTFHESGLHNQEASRYTVSEWLDKFQQYLLGIELGKWDSLGADAFKIFPHGSAAGVPKEAAVHAPTAKPVLMYGLMDITKNVEKVVSCLQSLGDETPKTLLVKLLKGSESTILPYLNQEGVDFSLFGSLKSMPQNEISHLVDYLVFENYLALGAGRKKWLEVTEKGQDYVMAKTPR